MASPRETGTIPQRRMSRPPTRNDRTLGQGPKTTRGGGPKALADSLRRVTRGALGQRSLAEQDLILDWPSVVGDDIAGLCAPQGLTFARREQRREGTLALKVRSGQATRLQHLAPQLIERINGYFGYHAVARLRLLPGAGANPDGGSAARPDPAAPGVERPDLTAIDDPALRAALARLGRAVKAPREPGA